MEESEGEQDRIIDEVVELPWIDEKLEMISTKMKDYPNFVLSSGCDTPPLTPKHNIDAFFEALETFNRR